MSTSEFREESPRFQWSFETVLQALCLSGSHAVNRQVGWSKLAYSRQETANFLEHLKHVLRRDTNECWAPLVNVLQPRETSHEALLELLVYKISPHSIWYVGPRCILCSTNLLQSKRSVERCQMVSPAASQVLANPSSSLSERKIYMTKATLFWSHWLTRWHVYLLSVGWRNLTAK